MTEEFDQKTQEMRDVIKKLIEKKEGWNIETGVFNYFAISKHIINGNFHDILTPLYNFEEKYPYKINHTGICRGIQNKEFKTIRGLMYYLNVVIDWIEDGYQKGLFCEEGVIK